MNQQKVCFYKLLRVPPTATSDEIKKAFLQRAHELHPDKHQGCKVKLAEFQSVNQAYETLKDDNRRRQYHQDHPHRYSNSAYTRSPNFNFNYRKVYATASPPPEWKQKVWDHKVHFDYHYGDGLLKETLERLLKEQEEKRKHNKAKYQYQSPLGHGFSFEQEDTTKNDKKQDPFFNANPYSKTAPQGPAAAGYGVNPDVERIIIDYEEADNLTGQGKMHVSRRERVVYDLEQKRMERRQRKQQETARNPFDPSFGAARQSSSTKMDAAHQARQEQYRQQQADFERRQYQHQQQLQRNFEFAGAGSTTASNNNNNKNDCVIL